MKILRPVAVTDTLLTYCNVPEADYAVWAVGTTYAAAAKVIKNHKIFTSVAGSNVGNDPEAVGSTFWVYYSATNRWKMFDGKVSDTTTNPASIALNFSGARVSGVTLLNVSGNTVVVTITDPIEGGVFTKTIDLIATYNVVDFYTYCFAPFLYTKNVYVELPVYGNSTISIVINSLAGNAECGEVVFGLYSEMGDTQFGAGLSIQDYSVKQTDAFGNYTILQRAFSRRGSFDLSVDNSIVAAVIATLEEFRSTPVVWIPTDDLSLSSPLIIYGYYRDFKASVNYYNESSISLELEGLT